MDKILKLLIDDFQNEKPSSEYQLVLRKFCKAEVKFMATLSEKQKAEYMKLDLLCGELDVAELNNFAKFLYKSLKN